MHQRVRGYKRPRLREPPSITVDRLPSRTVAPHGVTGPELERFSDAVHFMGLYCEPRRSGLWWLSTDKGTDRPTIADIQKRVTRLQTDHGLRPFNVTTFEARGGLHGHIAFLGNSDIAGRLTNSAAFGELIQVDPVTDPAGLARKYLAKERTPQAG